MSKRLPLLLLAFTIFLAGSARSDVIGEGPRSNINSTVIYITSITKDKIDFPDASLEEVIDFLNRWGDENGRGVRIDASKLPSPATIRVKLTEKGITFIRAAALLAAQTKASLLIEPGKISFTPKPGGAKK